MSTTSLRILTGFLLFATISAQYANDDLFILIEEVSVYSCRGVKNEIKITEDDINVVNDKGNKVYYIRAPGNYSLHFKNINVQKDFGFLAGEIGVTLQVPIIEGPAGMRFDIPYPMIPETGLLHQKCDANSGIVERNGRQYCRYCDLCAVSQSVESNINKDHTFLPTVQGDTEANGKCGSVAADSYEFKKTIALPGRSALERMVKEKANGLDKEITKRLNKGQGRFQVFLNLIAAQKPSMSQKMFFDNSADCKCCNSKTANPQCDSYSYMYCDIEDCKSAWAHQCLHNTARIAACFSVEFNYRMTTSYSEVLEFLRENNYPNQEVEYGRRTTPRPKPAVPARSPLPQPSRAVIGGPRRPPQPLQPVPQPLEQSENTGEEQEVAEKPVQEEQVDAETPLNERCVARMPEKMTHLRRYCTIFWNPKLCCTHCSGVCPSDDGDE